MVDKVTGSEEIAENNVDEAVGATNAERKDALKVAKLIGKGGHDGEYRKSNGDKYTKLAVKSAAKAKKSTDDEEKSDSRVNSKGFNKIAANNYKHASLNKNAYKVVHKEEEMTDHVVETTEDQIDETAAAETLKVHPSNASSKMAMISKAVEVLGAMSKSDLVDFFNKSIAQIGHEADAIGGGAAAKNKATIVAKKTVKEDIAEVFGESDLSEEFKEKVTTLFEAALNVRLVEAVAEVEEQFEDALAKIEEETAKTLAEKVEEVVLYTAETWLEQNELAVQESLRTKLALNFIDGLRNLFVESYIEVPDEKVDVLEGMAARIEELEADLNEAVSANMELSAAIEESDKEKIVGQVAEGLVLTNAEKFRTLAEGIDYDGDSEVYRKKLEVVKETYFPADKKASTQIVSEDTENQLDESSKTRGVNDPLIKNYVEAISTSLKNR